MWAKPKRIFTFASAVFLIFILGVFFLYQKKFSFQQNQITPAVTPNTQTSASPSASTSTEPYTAPALKDQSLKMQFVDASQKLVANQDFPAEVKNIDPRTLVALRCSNYYVSDPAGKNFYSNDVKATTNRPVIDAEFNQLIASAEKILPQNQKISAGRYCQGEDGRKFVEYEVHSSTEGSVAYLGLINADESVMQIAKMPNDGAAYFSCGFPIEYTKNQVLYYLCTGENKKASMTAVYKIDLEKKKSEKLITCNANDGNTAVCK